MKERTDSITRLKSSGMRLTLGPRPGRKSVDRLRELQLTHCCTLLSAREGAPLIEKVCQRIRTPEAPFTWVWLPIEGGNLEVLRHTSILPLLDTLATSIATETTPHVYLHCSAGIHRTGFFAYILLRILGHDAAAAIEKLAELRTVTFAQVGDERLELAEHVVQGLISPLDLQR